MHWPDPIPLPKLLRESRPVPRHFYLRPATEVARDMLGKIVVHENTAGRIVEAEAYLGLEDQASHAFRGMTPRTRVLFGPPGHAYVYLSYGANECLNLVAEPEGKPGCVLIRALEPLAGVEIMRSRRTTAERIEDLTSGPGKLTRAMDITRRHYGADVTRGSLTVRAREDEPAFETLATPRIGLTVCADRPLRFVIAGNRFLSGPRALSRIAARADVGVGRGRGRPPHE